MILKFLTSIAFIGLLTTSSIAIESNPQSIEITKPVQVDELTKQTQQMFDPVVQINHNCSGTIFSSEINPQYKKVVTLILTSKHCTQNPGVGELIEIEKDKYDDKLTNIGSVSYVGNVIMKSNQYDLAIVMLKDHNTIFPVAKIATPDQVLKFGMTTWAVGYPLGRSITFTVGTLGNREFLNNLPAIPSGEPLSIEGEFQRSSASINPGSSGGPLFIKDKDGNYVLIGTASLMVGANADFIAYYSTLEQINEFLVKGM